MNSAPRIALITPTLGRASLSRTLTSAVDQLVDGDEWLVVGDGDRTSAQAAVNLLGDRRIRYFAWSEPDSTYGNAQRNAAMRRAAAQLFVFLDDDDELLPGALDAIRREALHGRPMMFRMDYVPGRRVLWREPVLREGNVGGAMFVVPNVPGRWSPWPVSDRSCVSDLAFIRSTLALWPDDALRWCREVICRCPGHGEGR